MAPFRWPDTRHDVALAIEVSTSNPEKPQDWEAIAGRLSTAFSTNSVQVELKGRGCRERMERLLDKFKAEDAKAIKRSGTEEEYGEPHQLLENITSYRRDFAELKNKEKELKKKKVEDDRKRAETMKIAAMEGMAKRKSSDSSADISTDESASGDEDNTKKSNKDGKTKKRRFSKLSAIEMLDKKNEKRAESKDKELELRQRELEFNKIKFEVEAQERQERLKLELEERKTIIELLKKHI